jgi:hypothetical protein
MQKPNNYDTTQAAGEFEPIKLGGTVCAVLSPQTLRMRREPMPTI